MAFLSRSLFCASILLPLLPLAQAAPPLTLNQAIQSAKGNNPQIQYAQAAFSEASWRKLEAVSGHIPRVSIDAMRLLDVDYLAMPFGGATVQVPNPPKTNLALNASWTLFDGLKSIRNLQAANLAAEAAELDLARANLQIEDETRLRFYQALGAQLLAQVAEQNIKTLQDHFKKASDLLAEGQSTKFDLLRVKVQLSEAFPEKVAADDNVTTARNALAQVMGTAMAPAALTGNLPEPQADQVPANLQFDPAQRQDLNALLDRAEAKSQAHLASMASWMPTLTLAYQYQFYNVVDSGSVFSIPYSNAHMLLLNLSWNLFDGGASIAHQEQTFFQQKQSDAQARSLQLSAPNEFDLYKRRFAYNVALFRARKESIETAEESVRLAKIGYEAGTRTSSDVLDSELDLFRARAGAVRAQVDALEALIHLELSLGRKL